VSALLDEKYAAFRPVLTKAPKATTEHYRRQALIRLEPAGKFLTWDNSRLNLGAGG